jgi:hypothetical protein
MAFAAEASQMVSLNKTAQEELMRIGTTTGWLDRAHARAGQIRLGVEGEVPSNLTPWSAILDVCLNAMCWAARWNRAALTH